jgi:hypothetical protein
LFVTLNLTVEGLQIVDEKDTILIEEIRVRKGVKWSPTRSGEVAVLIVAWTSRPVIITKYYPGNKIEKNDMSGACSMYGGKERCIQDFGGET